MPQEKICPECKSSFQCCSDKPGCWCEQLPNVIVLNEDAECLCPLCLEKKIKVTFTQGNHL